MAWDQTRKRNYHVMFVVGYEDARTAYIRIAPNLLEHGDHVVPGIVRERQQKDEILVGAIKAVKRLR
jgi:hypothetical protein